MDFLVGARMDIALGNTKAYQRLLGIVSVKWQGILIIVITETIPISL